jgi:hypothetical protein
MSCFSSDNLISIILRTTQTGGTGPYISYYFEDASFPNHTIYQPKDYSHLKLPVIAWANGGCAINGTNFAGFLGEVASYGAFIIAVGSIEGVPYNPNATANVVADVHPERQNAAINWISRVAGTGQYRHVDASRLSVWGQSCGGLESYYNAFDGRSTSVGIFDSGELTVNDSIAFAARVTKPIFYFLGGPTDVAYPNVREKPTLQ